jgi:hypothetical protein
MRKLIIISLIAALFLPLLSLNAQVIIHNSSINSVCYASNKVNRIFIPPPKDFYNKKGLNGATIIVNYIGFPEGPKAAVEYAVSILSSILPKDATFTLTATWIQLTPITVLGSTSISSFFLGTAIDAINPFNYYPVALAEKIAEKTLNDGVDGDINLRINSSANWYLGTDGITPVTKYDLVSVALHELCHGIGFYDSFTVTNSIGSYGLNTLPLIYDTFIETFAGVKLTDTLAFANNSLDLGNQLTGNLLYFNGPVLRKNPSGRLASIYAPSVWDPGSSLSHLDENRTAQIDALMTPFLDKGEAIHSPGDLALAILGDVGWINTRINHKQFHNTEKNLSEITFAAKIKSDTSFNRDNVGLVYSFDGFTNYDTLYLVPPQADDSFRINLNIPAYNTSVSYYFLVKDYFNRIYKLPSEGQTAPFKFFIGTDTDKPIIFHTPVDNLFDKTPSIKFIVNADDNIGIDTVYIEYKKNNGALKHLGLSNDSLNIYSGVLYLMAESIQTGDSILYRVVAIDKALSPNQKTLPASGFYTIHFTSTLSVVDFYNTDFTGAADDFLNKGFSITQPSQFDSPALHTKHPYESPDKDGESIEYTSVLMHPVKVDATGIYITFQEIVLVEPGETGSVFGSPDFYDYVIVEGSKDFGKSWFPLAPGYDSRISSVFLSDYNSSISGQNSTFVGSQSMYIKHTINIRTMSSFSPGDSLLIRFRLFSDPYAHGWGWAIDDLSIKSIAAGVPSVSTSAFNIFPNPGDGHIKIDPGETPFGLQVTYQVLNAAGIRIREGKVNAGSSNSIDISNQPPGLYIILFRSDNKIRTVKYSLIKE